MRIIAIIAVVLLTTLGIYGIVSAKTVSTPQATSFSSIQSDVKSGAILYDVRTADEYKAGHFENAVNFSLQDMQAGSLPNIPKDQKLYLYCKSGNRSSQAAIILKKAGFTNVTDLGGLQDVQSSGGELVQ